MQVFKIGIIAVFLTATFFNMGCKKTITQETIYDNVIYEVDTVKIYSSNIEKNKQKTDRQYISILYADLFRQNISAEVLNDLEQLKLSIGDNGMANEMIINNFVINPNIQIPSNAAMRADIPKFIDETYIRFFQREATEYEKVYFKQMIEADAALTPELIYIGFATSNEYLFY